jgi:hypothetical protein
MDLLVDNPQFWVLVIGAIVPLVTYVLNNVGPWVSETLKAGVLVVVSAAAGALYTAIGTDSFGWNEPTFQLVLSAVVGALMAHHWLWKPAKVNEKLGAVEATTPGE